MSDDYPPEVVEFHNAIKRLPGVLSVDTGIDPLEGVDIDQLSLIIYGDFPHAALRRSGGGLKDEAWIHPEIVFIADLSGWWSLEYLAWWVRDLSRSGELVQMRPQALPPIANTREQGMQIQLGDTLKFVIDLFMQLPDRDTTPALERLREWAESLNEDLDSVYDRLFS